MIETVIYNGYEFQIDRKNPFIRFKGGSKPKIPKAPDPSPTPTKVDEEVEAKDRERRKQRIQAAGRAGTILTEKTSGSATLLGRSTS